MNRLLSLLPAAGFGFVVAGALPDGLFSWGGAFVWIAALLWAGWERWRGIETGSW